MNLNPSDRTVRQQEASIGPYGGGIFYAGLFSLPFIVILCITGSIYLFRPQIEAWLDRPLDRLTIDGPRATPAAQVAAALASSPGASLVSYGLPPSPSSAARVLISAGERTLRVYVHPESLAILRIADEDNRPMRWLFRAHGELLMGNWGSYLVELAASWTIVMILSGLWLWWPRDARGLGGILYPRLRAGGRTFWRDLHAVTGVWVSALVLVMLFSGLPWAKFWGDYFRTIRQLTHTAAVRQDWVNGAAIPRSMADEHASHRGHRGGHTGPTDLAALDRIASTVAPMQLPPPVLISPPDGRSLQWSAKSETANRPQRVDLRMDPTTGEVVSRSDFSNKLFLDRLVAVGIAWHEGQLCGWPNQLLGVLTALGLLLLCFSSVVMWWRRRAVGVLGAPRPIDGRRCKLLVVAVICLAIYLPLFAASLVVVRGIEWLVLRRIEPVRQWLGLSKVRGG